MSVEEGQVQVVRVGDLDALTLWHLELVALSIRVGRTNCISHTSVDSIVKCHLDYVVGPCIHVKPEVVGAHPRSLIQFI